jgi:ABC-2 type transport system permease protein
MKKIFHVAVREFLGTVATKGFLIGLVLMPVIMLIAIVGMSTLFNEEAPRVTGEIAVIDPTGAIYDDVRDYLLPEAIAERRDDFNELVDEQMPDAVKALADSSAAAEARQKALAVVMGQVPDLQVVDLGPAADRESAKTPLSGEGDGGRLALIIVHENAVESDADDKFGKYDLFVREKLDDRVVDEIRRGMRNAIVNARVENEGLNRALIDSLTTVGRVRSKTVTEEGEQDTHEDLAVMVPAAFMLLLFVSVMTSGQALMTTTVEEKSSRVVEVLLSAVSPMQLMTGKILGQMFVGFIILAVYGGMGIGALVTFALMDLIELSMLFYLFIFYLIAHFVIASLLASIGAAVNEMREAQNLMGPVMMVLMIPRWRG